MIRKAGFPVSQDSFEEHTYQNALNVPIELDEAPTTAGGQLPRANDFGFYNGNLYMNLNGTIYKFNGTSV